MVMIAPDAVVPFHEKGQMVISLRRGLVIKVTCVRPAGWYQVDLGGGKKGTIRAKRSALIVQ
jgi:hypothetical protein